MIIKAVTIKCIRRNTVQWSCICKSLVFAWNFWYYWNSKRNVVFSCLWQDLRPLYAGRCEYLSSETASERDVRNRNPSFGCFFCITCTLGVCFISTCTVIMCVVIPKGLDMKSFVTYRCHVILRVHPVTCTWRATPVTAASSTTAGSESTQQTTGKPLNQSSLALALCVVLLSIFKRKTKYLHFKPRTCLFFLTFVSENILLSDFKIKMLWKSLGNHPWFGSRSFFL